MRNLSYRWGLVLLLYFLVFSCAEGVVINEIQVAPTSERFVELYNDSSNPVDLTGWYIQRKTATGSDFNSFVSNTNFAGKIIPANGFFVISRTALSK